MKIESTISAHLISAALEYYEQLEYQLTPVPLLVEPEISALCRPADCKDIHHSESLVYVGSAEQSFLQMYKDGCYLSGKNQAITPCMRDEKFLGNVHFRTFLKIELIHIDSSDYLSMAKHAHTFMTSQGIDCYMNSTPDGIDILATRSGLELGSYGSRNALGMTYAYGTGLAEPRASIAMYNG